MRFSTNKPMLIGLHIWIFILSLTRAIQVTSLGAHANDTLSIESVRIWSILNEVLPNDNTKNELLNQLYPIITGMDTFEESEEEDDYDLEDYEDQGEDTLKNRVIHILESHDKKNAKSRTIDTTYNAKQFEIYYDLYPFGFYHSQNDTIPKENFFILNGKIFNKSDDMFYFKSTDLNEQAKLLDNEIISARDGDDESMIIGTNNDAPLVIFYGCPNYSEFSDFNRNLFIEATETSKIRFIWKPNCDIQSIGNIDHDFPVTFTLKDSEDKESWRLLENLVNIPKKFRNSLAFEQSSNQNISDLDLKLTTLISRHYKKSNKFSATIKYFSEIVNNLPFVMNNLLNVKVSKKEENNLDKSNSILSQMGIDYHMLGLFINGQNIKLSSLDHYSLINAITKELRGINQLKNYLSDYEMSSKTSLITKAKSLLQFFTNLSITNLQDLQPIRIDLHRIEKFSDNVIYFNDIEKDPQYDELSTDINKFLAESSKFGEIPEYRKNWNEIVFVINMDEVNPQKESNANDALNALIRTLQVVQQGYPQRIGFLPFGSIESESIISKIYEMKEKNNLGLLANFLEDLVAERIDKDTLKFNPDFGSNIKELLESLDIENKTSVIINGEVYPFKANAWHYLLAKVIKKDTAFLKSEITNELNSGKSPKKIDIRGLLHLKSAVAKNDKYTPDYFSNALYTIMNNDVLSEYADRSIYYTINENLNILHTVTLVEDFSSANGLQRLKNLLLTKFDGVRMRVIQNGEIDTAIWTNLKNNLNKYKEKESLISYLDGLIFKVKDVHNDSVIPNFLLNVLHKWLPDIPELYLESKSFMVLNGRFIHLEGNEIPTTVQYESIIKREAKRVLDTVFSLENVFPRFSEGKIDPDFIEMVSALLSKLFYHGSQYYNDGFQYTTETVLVRNNIDEYLIANDITIFEDDKNKLNANLLDVTLIVDPLEERTQKLLSFIPMLQQLDFIKLKIVLLPTLNIAFLPNERVYINSFDKHDLPPEILNKFDIEIETPNHFAIYNNSILEGMSVEAHVYNSQSVISEGAVNGLGGLTFKVLDNNGSTIANFTTMETFGFGQFIVHDLFKSYTIECATPGFEVDSISTHFYSDNIDETQFTVSNMNPIRLTISVKQDSAVSHKEYTVSENSNVNIFTIISDVENDETKYKDNVFQIISSSKDTHFTFWLLEDFTTTKTLKLFADFINNDSTINANINFIRYDWPQWLRPQRFRNRKADISRFLFLDVLFPLDVTQLIYMGLDQMEKLIDPLEVLNTDVKLAPFSMLRMEGDGYWKHGYWEKRLKNNGLAFYSTEPVFLINLEELRNKHYGDVLRIHYQRLSGDTNSLVNIGQDLLNDIQNEVPISRLRRVVRKRYVKSSKEQVVEWQNAMSNFEESEKYKLTMESSQEEESVEENDILHDEL